MIIFLNFIAPFVMETPNNPSARQQLDASKERLGTVLRHLQQVMEKQLQQAALLKQENSALKKQLEQLTQANNLLKTAGNTAFACLNQSIDQLETLLGEDTNHNAHTQHQNPQQ